MKDDVTSRVMKEMGRRGGKKGGPKGGKARMDALSPEERSALGRKGSDARWGNGKKKKEAEEKTAAAPKPKKGEDSQKK